MVPRKYRKEGSSRQQHPRGRRGLLKCCNRIFHPRSVWSRYCSARCAAAARRWSVVRAQQKYQRSAGGRQQRARQSREYRKRQKFRQSTEGVASVSEAIPKNEGDQCEKICGGDLCARPGCYEHVVTTARSPLKKFCSANCCEALRRVRQRERRWCRVLGIHHKTFYWHADKQAAYVPHIAFSFP